MNKFIKAIAALMLIITAFCIVACKPEVDPVITDDDTPAPEGAINGVFSISNRTKVYFSQGNLQYQASTDTWRFAENQWDIIGEDNNNSEANEGWIDLFEWETSGIDHGALEEGNWRAMTKEEWCYLLNERPMTIGNRFVRAIVNNVKGIVVFPDNWSESTYALIDDHGIWNYNVITELDWSNILEKSGAVFIPSTPVREGDTIIVPENGLEFGRYWSSTGYDEERSFGLYFGVGFLYCGTYNRHSGYPLRLVCSVE